VTEERPSSNDDSTVVLTPPQVALALAILLVVFWLRKRARRVWSPGRSTLFHRNL